MSSKSVEGKNVEWEKTQLLQKKVRREKEDRKNKQKIKIWWHKWVKI